MDGRHVERPQLRGGSAHHLPVGGEQDLLTRSFSAKSKDRGELQGTEVMGWDPIKGSIHAWVFDSEGGFGEAIWTRDGNRWLIESVTTLPDGRKASAHNTITHVSDDQYTWESTNRVLDGEVNTRRREDRASIAQRPGTDHGSDDDAQTLSQ